MVVAVIYSSRFCFPVERQNVVQLPPSRAARVTYEAPSAESSLTQQYPAEQVVRNHSSQWRYRDLETARYHDSCDPAWLESINVRLLDFFIQVQYYWLIEFANCLWHLW